MYEMWKVKEWTRVGPRDFGNVMKYPLLCTAQRRGIRSLRLTLVRTPLPNPVSTELKENFPCNAARDIGVVHEK